MEIYLDSAGERPVFFSFWNYEEYIDEKKKSKWKLTLDDHKPRKACVVLFVFYSLLQMKFISYYIALLLFFKRFHNYFILNETNMTSN